MSKKANAQPAEEVTVLEQTPLENITKALTGLVGVLTDLATVQSAMTDQPLKVAVYRQAQAKFLQTFSTWVQSLNIKTLVSFQQSESDGNITGTIFYR